MNKSDLQWLGILLLAINQLFMAFLHWKHLRHTHQIKQQSTRPYADLV